MDTAVATLKERQNKIAENILDIKTCLTEKGFTVYDAIYALPQNKDSCWNPAKGKWENIRRAKNTARFVVELGYKKKVYQFLVRVIDADYNECIVCLWTLCNTVTHDGTARALHEYGKPLGIYHVSPGLELAGSIYSWSEDFLHWFITIVSHIIKGHKKCDLCGEWVSPKPGSIEGTHTFICDICANEQ